jgi:hypothetical protein
LRLQPACQKNPEEKYRRFTMADVRQLQCKAL